MKIQYIRFGLFIGFGYWRDNYTKPFSGYTHNILLPFVRLQFGVIETLVATESSLLNSAKIAILSKIRRHYGNQYITDLMKTLGLTIDFREYVIMKYGQVYWDINVKDKINYNTVVYQEYKNLYPEFANDK